MKLFGKNIVVYEDEISLDSVEDELLDLKEEDQIRENALSEDNDKARNDKARAMWRDKAALDARKTKICEEFWLDFIILSKTCMLHDPEADLYDAFETIRVKFLGGWGFTKAYLAKLDAEIALEDGPWT